MNPGFKIRSLSSLKLLDFVAVIFKATHTRIACLFVRHLPLQKREGNLAKTSGTVAKDRGGLSDKIFE